MKKEFCTELTNGDKVQSAGGFCFLTSDIFINDNDNEKENLRKIASLLLTVTINIT